MQRPAGSWLQNVDALVISQKMLDKAKKLNVYKQFL